jgi:nitroreductase
MRELLSQATHLQWAAHMALRAPSVWNTQPWRWRVLEDSIELWADRERHLVTADPDGLLLTVSCGTALHHLRTALAASGDEVIVERLPDPAVPDLLARVTLRWPRVPIEDDVDYARFAAIARRRTDRRPVADIPVAGSVLTRLRAAAEAEGARLTFLDPDGIVRLAVIAARAADAEAHDPGFLAELDRWTHRPRFASDGVAPVNVPQGADRVVPLRDFAPGDEHVDAHPGTLDRYATYGVLWGERDEPLSWLRAGEALSAVLLDGAVEGLAMSPISTVVECDGSRVALRDLLPAVGAPCLVLRLGYPVRFADEPGARTARLAASRRIDIDPAAAPVLPPVDDPWLELTATEPPD